MTVHERSEWGNQITLFRLHMLTFAHHTTLTSQQPHQAQQKKESKSESISPHRRIHYTQLQPFGVNAFFFWRRWRRSRERGGERGRGACVPLLENYWLVVPRPPHQPPSLPCFPLSLSLFFYLFLFLFYFWLLEVIPDFVTLLLHEFFNFFWGPANFFIHPG